MPKHKTSKKSDTSDSDSGPEDRGPAKKSKSSNSKSTGDSDNNSWEIGRNRYAKLTEFKGKWYIDIREFYNADGEMRPGKKGIMLTMEQWQKFKAVVGEIDEAVKRNV